MKGKVLILLLLVRHKSASQIALVATQNHRDVLTNAPYPEMPAFGVLEGQLVLVIKDHNCRLTLNVVTIIQPTELLLTSAVPLRRSGALCGPDVEDDDSVVGVELDGVYFYTHSSVVAFVKLTGAVSLD